ncbi:hypothetical protein [Sphingobacterium sp.]|uniref:hypothetical protein n=1 Tax=Sphingobacterium sp. TaxID=341027 RepID=UPI002FD92FF4
MKNNIYIKNRLRVVVILTFLILCFHSEAQVKYFILDDSFQAADVTKYKLNTNSLYRIDREISLFNLITSASTNIGHDGRLNILQDYDIMLFAVLPDLSGDEDWIKINPDTIQKAIVNFENLKELRNNNILSFQHNVVNEKTKFFNSYKIVIKQGDTYYASKNCLLQFYSVRNRSDFFANIYGRINTVGLACSILQFEKIFKSTYPNYEFPIFRIGEGTHSFLDWATDRREYLSKTLKLKNNSDGYQFWTYMDWTVPDSSYDIERGIDRFVYLPDKGIIGGSFDFYFYFNRKKLPIKYTDFLNNIKEEKVMIADDFK